MSKYYSLLFITVVIGLSGCHDNGLDPENHATAKLDGFNWSAQAEAKFSSSPGDRAVNIFLYSPNLSRPETTLGFLEVPLKSGEYTVVKTVNSFNSFDVLGYYQPEARLAPFIFYHPDESTTNRLTIESYDKLSGEIIFSFEGSFVNPPNLGDGVHQFEAGVGKVMLR